MIAAERARNPGTLDILKRWAEEKFKLPWTHECFQSRTDFELLIEMYEDYYIKNPIETRRTAGGHIQFANTGDHLLDKWESELAQGLLPDLYEGLPSRFRIRAEKSKTKDEVSDSSDLSNGFSEDYSMMAQSVTGE